MPWRLGHWEGGMGVGEGRESEVDVGVGRGLRGVEVNERVGV